ncbi:MAG: hypothetical protein LBT43_03620 [Prevotella sp.]|jgi:hypothetical protein|nr:hypothetical protein [Prevotella sp.]
MLQQRRKDFLMRLLEEFMKKLQQLTDNREKLSDSEQKDILNECFTFFSTNFRTSITDDSDILIEKINDRDLLEQYPKLLMMQYDLSEEGNKADLQKALVLIEYLQNTDVSYSWDRVVLREDILHRLDNND